MWRNGACATTSCKVAIRSASSGFANPRSSTAPSAIISCEGGTSETLSNKSVVNGSRSLRIVKYHAKGMAVAGADPAHPMAQVNAIESARPLHRPVMHGKNHGVALTQRQHLGARLHSWPLLGQHEFAAGEIAVRFRQQDRDLQRKNVFAVEILMQAIVVVFAVLQQQRRRPGLAGGMAALQKCFVTRRIADIDAHGLVPAISHVTKLRIERRPQFRDQVRKRIRKIFVLAAPEPVTSHHHPAAEMLVVRIKRRKRAALIRQKQSLQDGTALRIEIAARLRPVDGIDARGGGWRCGIDDILCGRFHSRQSRKSERFAPPDFREDEDVVYGTNISVSSRERGDP